MAIKPQMRSEGLTGDPLVQQRQTRTASFTRRAVESDVSLRETDQQREDREVAEKLELKRQEHERERIHKRELFEKQMQQLEIQQMQEERAMLAANSTGSSIDLWSEMENLSIGDRTRTSVKSLSKIGTRTGSGREEASEPTLDDNGHLSKLTEQIILEDDNDSSSNSLSSLHMNGVLNGDDAIWTKNGFVGSTALGSSSTSYLPFLPRRDDGDGFAGLDLAKAPRTQIRHSVAIDSGLTSEWPQYGKQLSERVPSTHVLHRTNSLVDYGLTGNPEESLVSALPKMNSRFSSEIIASLKGPSIPSFDGLKDRESPKDICFQFQQGYCSRGSLCPFVHLPSATPLSPGLGMTSSAVSSAPLSKLYSTESNHSLVGGPGFPFNVIPSSLNGSPTGPDNLTSNGVTLTSKTSIKRATTNDLEANRFTGAPLEGFVGQIYSLCKDQHGCRYLQKKLEEQNDKYLSVIFGEVFGHFIELMTDPFGNYLCQKLLEYCGDEQRTIIVESVAPELVNISLNMHGTRAVQKMIEFLSTPQQIAIVVHALDSSVVTLIKDLNGNHVIQKCLNKFTSDDNQFIYNAISAHCVEVATHRHGCCVLQRCLDHASVMQKIQLVQEITFHALTLVQDPYGNYVVQYVLELQDSGFTDALIRRFIGNVCILSVQKFSSNVMEKCIRVAKPETRRFLIEEMINKARLDKLLRDSFANYVIQTSLDYADPIQRAQLVECIRPFLPAIRNTPYGKRIQTKLHRDQMTTRHNSMGHLPINSMEYGGNMTAMNGFNGRNDINGMNGAMVMGTMSIMGGMPSHVAPGFHMSMNSGMGGYEWNYEWSHEWSYERDYERSYERDYERSHERSHE
ncbi:MAG: armadillo-type protein [Benniella sp.]|nr:MAG: armadillo-type protein [Benniella sp.]